MKCPDCNSITGLRFTNGIVIRCADCGWGTHTHIEIYEKALRIMAKEIVEYDAVMEAIYDTGDPDAHGTINEKDLANQIEITVQEALEEARKELCQT